MRVIAVLDLMHGLVVRGVGGRRNEYRPIRSPLVREPDPLHVAEAFRHRLGIDELYVADLDAIHGAPPATHIYEQLLGSGFALWVDAGLRSAEQAQRLAELRSANGEPSAWQKTNRGRPSKSGVVQTTVPGATGRGPLPGCSRIARVIAGLETLPDLATLQEMLAIVGSDRLALSLDMRDGRPIVSPRWTGPPEIEPIAQEAHRMGVRRFIVLDVARVGRCEGPGAVDLCRRLRDLGDDVEVVAGGGVRDADDLGLFAKAGCHAVLVATALHEGRVRRTDLERLR